MTVTRLQIAMLSTGEEILHGDIQDTNATWLSTRFFEEGFALNRRVAVGDKQEDITKELIRCSECADIVIVNGGLGPTSDDVTAEAMAVAMGVDLILCENWLDKLEAYYSARGRTMPKSNLKQALLPKGAEVVNNPVGTACGFSATMNNTLFYFTPGVPFEFKQMVDKEIIPQLQRTFLVQHKKQIHRFFTFGFSESWLNDQFQVLNLPKNMEIGYRSALPFIEVKLLHQKGADQAEAIAAQLRDIVADHLVSEHVPMMEHLATVMSKAADSLAMAEKFTQGQLTAWMNQTPLMRTLLKQSWVLNQAIKQDKSEYNPLAEVLMMATTSRQNAKAEIGLASGNCFEDRVALAISTPKGDCGMIVQRKTTMKDEHFVTYCSTLLLDMLRRYLENKEMFPLVSILDIKETLFMPIEA